ncbi:MAG: class I SAM-dependent methyltransferase [Acidobacteriia bacterium]|nr:class I SAM-dependent methyltransferase [Terriglobia bacterium]
MASFVLPHSLNTAPFDARAETYDAVFTESLVGKAQRSQVWREMDRVFHPGQRILEINCGTGVDAVRLAQRGLKVVACDSSARMIAVARRRLQTAGMLHSVELRTLATEQVASVGPAGTFDGLLSNFAGLNCVDDLGRAARSLAHLLRPGSKAMVCVFGRFCLWEMAWHALRGDLRKAFRRLRSGETLLDWENGPTLRVHYPSVRELVRLFSPFFRLKEWRGIGVLVPPTGLEPVVRRVPRGFRLAASIDSHLGRAPIARTFADHYLLIFERSAT